MLPKYERDIVKRYRKSMKILEKAIEKWGPYPPF